MCVPSRLVLVFRWFLLLSVALLLWGSEVKADPVCVPGTLQSYVNNYQTSGCQVGNLVFSGFQYSGTASNAPAVSAANIMVSANGLSGITFASSGWSVAGFGLLTSTITFTVSADSGAWLLNSTTLFMDTATPIAPGSAVANQYVCVSGSLSDSCSTGTLVQLLTFHFGQSWSLTSSSQFPSANQANVQIDLRLEANSASADISSLSSSFGLAPVPEPATFILVASGLFGLSLSWRRRSRT